MNSFWDDEFHVAAFYAFVIEARSVSGWPDSEAVRLRAYELYDDMRRADGRL